MSRKFFSAKSAKPYRRNTGIVVFNAAGKVLAGERRGYPGIYQFPQGGLEEGELPLACAWRELEEETGICLKGQKPVAELANWLTYEFPEDIPERLRRYRGQKQKWFFFFWNGDLSCLSPPQAAEAEFQRLEWQELEKVVKYVVAFKREVYNMVGLEGKKIIQRYLQKHQESNSHYIPTA